jgi:hypothetical protein
MDRVMDAGVGHPVLVLGVALQLVIIPWIMSSASRFGTIREPRGSGPAPESPGTVERRVLARIPQKRGDLGTWRYGLERRVMETGWS